MNIISNITGKPATPTTPPVLLMLFNRAGTTREVFKAVRDARPAKLFVAANGPRPDNPKDVQLCQAVRDIFTNVDWECELHTNFQETNIGMQQHWHVALDWFFDSVDAGIILEDDCVPHYSFFGYCDELLQKYTDDTRITHINGSNFQFGTKRGDASYYYSKYPHVWGWATWKRAWQMYDGSLSSFPQFKQNHIIDHTLGDERQKKYWMQFFEEIYAKIRTASDVTWLYSIWAQESFCITPNVNMITNIGHGIDAGHTVIKEKTMGQERCDIGTIIHPTNEPTIYDRKADAYTFKICYHRSFTQKVVYKIAILFFSLIQKIRARV